MGALENRRREEYRSPLCPPHPHPLPPPPPTHTQPFTHGINPRDFHCYSKQRENAFPTSSFYFPKNDAKGPSAKISDRIVVTMCTDI